MSRLSTLLGQRSVGIVGSFDIYLTWGLILPFFKPLLPLECDSSTGSSFLAIGFMYNAFVKLSMTLYLYLIARPYEMPEGKQLYKKDIP